MYLFIIIWQGLSLTSCASVKQTETSNPDSSAKSNFTQSSKSLFLDTSALGKFYFPIKGKVISHFGKRGSQNHTGTDIKLNHGDTVRAAFSGIVTRASEYYGYGNLVVLKHPKNMETYYAHLSKCLVNEGDSVLMGSPVGLGGRTGRATTDHLHFEIRFDKEAVNAEQFFNFDNLTVKSYKGNTAVVNENENKQKTQKQTKSKQSANETIYIVKKKDTLYSIAKRYGTTVDQLKKINNLKNNDLKIGLQLKLK